MIYWILRDDNQYWQAHNQKAHARKSGRDVFLCGKKESSRVEYRKVDAPGTFNNSDKWYCAKCLKLAALLATGSGGAS